MNISSDAIQEVTIRETDALLYNDAKNCHIDRLKIIHVQLYIRDVNARRRSVIVICTKLK